MLEPSGEMGKSSEESSPLSRQLSFSAPYRGLLSTSSTFSPTKIQRAQTERNIRLTKVGSNSNLFKGVGNGSNTTLKLRNAFLQDKSFSGSAKTLQRRDSLQVVKAEAKELTLENAKELAQKFQSAIDTVHQDETPLFSRRKSVAADALVKQGQQDGGEPKEGTAEGQAQVANRDLTDTPVAGSPIDAAIRKLLESNYVCANGVNLDNYLGKGVKIVRSDGRVDTLILVEEAGDGRVRCRKPNSSLFIVKKAKYCFCLPHLSNAPPAKKNQIVEEVEKPRKSLLKEYSADWSSSKTIHEEAPDEPVQPSSKPVPAPSQPAQQQKLPPRPKQTRFKDQEEPKEQAKSPPEEPYVASYSAPQRTPSTSELAETQQWGGNYYSQPNYASASPQDYSASAGAFAGQAQRQRAAAYRMQRMSPSYAGYNYNTHDYSSYGYAAANAAYSSLPPVAGATYPSTYGTSDYMGYSAYMAQQAYAGGAGVESTTITQADSSGQKGYSVVGYLEKWQICVDDRGRQFFIDTEAGTSHWSLPFKLSEMEEKKMEEKKRAAAEDTLKAQPPPLQEEQEEHEEHNGEDAEEVDNVKAKGARPTAFKGFFRRTAAS